MHYLYALGHMRRICILWSIAEQTLVRRMWKNTWLVGLVSVNIFPTPPLTFDMPATIVYTYKVCLSPQLVKKYGPYTRWPPVYPLIPAFSIDIKDVLRSCKNCHLYLHRGSHGNWTHIKHTMKPDSRKYPDCHEQGIQKIY